MIYKDAALDDLDTSSSTLNRSVSMNGAGNGNSNNSMNGGLNRRRGSPHIESGRLTSAFAATPPPRGLSRASATGDEGVGMNPNSAFRLKKSQSSRDMNGNGVQSKFQSTLDIPTAPLGELIGVVDPTSAHHVILGIIEDPIQCGYLRTFCETNNNSQNLPFILEIIKFRELFIHEKTIWRQNWMELDAEHMPADGPVPADFGDTHPWPSRKLDRKTVEDQVDVIWTKHLAKTAGLRVLVVDEVIANTKKRLRMLNVYGPEVFGECILDPLFSMEVSMPSLQKDILPLFLNSTQCTDMVIRIDSLRMQPSVNSLRVNPPGDSLLLTKNTDYFENDDKRFRLDDVLKDKILYGELLSYLRRCGQSENLLCIRMVEQFEDLFASMSTSKDLSKSWLNCVTHAWSVFRYFVAPGSPFEIVLSAKHKKDIMLSLAKPTKNMFLELKKGAYTSLSSSFSEYKTTEEYAQLIVLMRTEKNMALSSTRLSIPSLLSWFFS
jgi:hypothetical protein